MQALHRVYGFGFPKTRGTYSGSVEELPYWHKFCREGNTRISTLTKMLIHFVNVRSRCNVPKNYGSLCADHERFCPGVIPRLHDRGEVYMEMREVASIQFVDLTISQHMALPAFSRRIHVFACADSCELQ